MSGRVHSALLAIALAAGSPAWAAPGAASWADTLVAVASSESPFSTLAPGDLRLTFLGAPVAQAERRAKPVLNVSDAVLYEVFLQKVVFLSSQHYQRQLVSHVFQSGGARPTSVSSQARLVELLREDPSRVSFMWRRDAETYEGIKVIRVLWQGSVR